MKRPFELIKNFNMLYNLKLGELPPGTLAPEVYEFCESVWIKQTGKRFYKNYRSFQNCRSIWINKRVNKNSLKVSI